METRHFVKTVLLCSYAGAEPDGDFARRGEANAADVATGTERGRPSQSDALQSLDTYFAKRGSLSHHAPWPAPCCWPRRDDLACDKNERFAAIFRTVWLGLPRRARMRLRRYWRRESWPFHDSAYSPRIVLLPDWPDRPRYRAGLYAGRPPGGRDAAGHHFVFWAGLSICCLVKTRCPNGMWLRLSTACSHKLSTSASVAWMAVHMASRRRPATSWSVSTRIWQARWRSDGARNGTGVLTIWIMCVDGITETKRC